MSENKTGRYFKYAIGEIILVVIGILIALQINNWNTERLERKTETEYYCQLLDDFELDKAELKGLIDASKQRVEVAKQLLLDIDAQTKTKEEILLTFFFALRSDAFIPSKLAITDLTSTGKLSLIKDKTLKKKLFEHYENLDNKSEIAKSNRISNSDKLLSNNVIEFGWQDFSGLELDKNIRKTLPSLDWHLDKNSPYYKDCQESLIFSIGINFREQELYNSILTDIEPLIKELKLNCNSN
ncbi:DUF6090 family protein [Winogradskyella jejuensis]|uniref:Uncharacterized protein n=1 Tax=Winogradskyella jejuensis TaxID=1089305 RepID=A0A1M5STP1_9FLAO|nr:DUF6090 family protein [Winogradskyella jejuensis]SHH41895.1 hypothetical protein SAMN05444148_1968 [Winogradskyella jejuensis]